MKNTAAKEKVILFTCNWHAFSSLEAAAKENLGFSPALIPIRISCLGRITPGIILKAFEGGAAGVCLMGCPDGDCRYQNGNREAFGIYQETKKILALLGFNKDLLQFHQTEAGDAENFHKQIEQMLKFIQEDRKTR